MAESFNATIKKELIHLHTWPNLGRVKSAVFEYIESYYNRKRPHTRIGNLSPHEFELSFPVPLDSGMGEAA
jgi:putative transposase